MGEESTQRGDLSADTASRPLDRRSPPVDARAVDLHWATTLVLGAGEELIRPTPTPDLKPGALSE